MAIPELKVGDVLLVGKWKNRRAIIKGFSKDSNHQPLVHTDKGDFPVFHFRVEKLMTGEGMNKALELLALCNENSPWEINKYQHPTRRTPYVELKYNGFLIKKVPEKFFDAYFEELQKLQGEPLKPIHADGYDQYKVLIIGGRFSEDATLGYSSSNKPLTSSGENYFLVVESQALTAGERKPEARKIIEVGHPFKLGKDSFKIMDHASTYKIEKVK